MSPLAAGVGLVGSFALLLLATLGSPELTFAPASMLGLLGLVWIACASAPRGSNAAVRSSLPTAVTWPVLALAWVCDARSERAETSQLIWAAIGILGFIELGVWASKRAARTSRSRAHAAVWLSWWVGLPALSSCLAASSAPPAWLSWLASASPVGWAFSLCGARGLEWSASWLSALLGAALLALSVQWPISERRVA